MVPDVKSWATCSDCSSASAAAVSSKACVVSGDIPADFDSEIAIESWDQAFYSPIWLL